MSVRVVRGASYRAQQCGFSMREVATILTSARRDQRQRLDEEMRAGRASWHAGYFESVGLGTPGLRGWS